MIPLPRRFLAFSTCCWLLLLANTCPPQGVLAKKDRNQPHEHRGKLAPYKPGPFQRLSLSKSEESKLAAGDAVMKQTPADPKNPAAGGGAICIQDIAAPKVAVWNQILDLPSYSKKVAKVVKCSNYQVSTKRNHSTIKTRMVLGVLPGYSYESYYDHTFHPHQDSMTWTLDYDKTSDFDDVSGHWHLEEAPYDATKTRVFYACDIALKGAVPGPILNYISKAALKQATAWVKKESEANPTATAVAQKYKYHGSVPAQVEAREPAMSGRGGGGWWPRGLFSKPSNRAGWALFSRTQ